MKRNKKEKKVALFGSLYVMVLSAIFVAISIVCGKYLAIPGGQVLRFSFENLTVILSGIAFGPIVGAVVGIVADLLGCVLVGYQINPILTLGAASIGALSGLCFMLTKKMPVFACLSMTVLIPHLIGSVIIKTFGLASFYDMPFVELMLWRLLNYAIVGTLELVIIYALLRNKTIRNQLRIEMGGREK